MFFKGSRYERVPTQTLTDASGRVWFEYTATVHAHSTHERPA